MKKREARERESTPVSTCSEQHASTKPPTSHPPSPLHATEQAASLGRRCPRRGRQLQCRSMKVFEVPCPACLQVWVRWQPLYLLKTWCVDLCFASSLSLLHPAALSSVPGLFKAQWKCQRGGRGGCTGTVLTWMGWMDGRLSRRRMTSMH